VDLLNLLFILLGSFLALLAGSSGFCSVALLLFFLLLRKLLFG
jgi:hypothetical protein